MLKTKSAVASAAARYPGLVSLAALVVVSLALAAVASVDAQMEDTTPFTPGFQVRTWATSDGFTLSTDIAELRPYLLETVGYYRVIPFVAIGLLSWIAIFCWGLCRCCGKCYCGVRQTSFCGRLMFILLLISVVVSLGLVGGGFEANKAQNTAFENFPTIIDSVVSFVDDVSAEASSLNATAETIIQLGEDLKAEDPGEMFIMAADVNAFQDFVRVVGEAGSLIEDAAANVDFSTFEDFSDQSDMYNGIRNQGFTITLGVLLAFLLIEALFAFLDYCLDDGSRPSQNGCKVIVYFFAFITFLLLLLLWILGGALIAASTVTSDVCIDADAQFLNLLDAAGVQGQGFEIATYFLTCDTNTSAVHPFANETAQIAMGLNDTLEALTEFEDDADSCTPPSGLDCDQIQLIIDYIISNVTELQADVGTLETSTQSGSETGILSLVSCSSLNGRYQNVLNVFCGDFVEALGLSTAVIVGFAVIYLFSQVITRIVSDAGREDEKSNVV